ncbi:MAG TPA: cytidine deaminase [Acidimicrobiales bacterium]|nr:cytidine deaminase [Acidimicrobiales bacterium]
MGRTWAELRAEATAVAQKAYPRASHFRVGAAGETTGGRLVVGCNVESASYGLTLCAEAGLVSALYASRPDPADPDNFKHNADARLAMVSIVRGDGVPVAPCGRCRQLLSEAGGPALLIDWDPSPRTIGELLPDAFDWTDVEAPRP